MIMSTLNQSQLKKKGLLDFQQWNQGWLRLTVFETLWKKSQHLYSFSGATGQFEFELLSQAFFE